MVVFELSALDSDGDTLPDDWETRYGLDATSAAGVNGAAGDPDGDGLSNAQEYAAHSHPANLPSATRYLAEGATGVFETRIAIANPGAATARVLLRFLQGNGTVTSSGVTVPPRQSRKVAVSRLPDLTGAEFSTVVSRINRSSWIDRCGGTRPAYGSHAEASVVAPALLVLAEGATHSGFDLFYLLQNPNTDAQVRVRYLRPAARRRRRPTP